MNGARAAIQPGRLAWEPTGADPFDRRRPRTDHRRLGSKRHAHPGCLGRRRCDFRVCAGRCRSDQHDGLCQLRPAGGQSVTGERGSAESRLAAAGVGRDARNAVAAGGGTGRKGPNPPRIWPRRKRLAGAAD